MPSNTYFATFKAHCLSASPIPQIPRVLSCSRLIPMQTMAVARILAAPRVHMWCCLLDIQALTDCHSLSHRSWICGRMQSRQRNYLDMQTAAGDRFQVEWDLALNMDNQSAIQVAKHPEHHGRMKHLDLCQYWLQDIVDKGIISPHFIPTSDMPADLLTKTLPWVKVQHFCSLLGLGPFI